MKLTMAQALVKFLDNQYISFDGKETKFVKGIFGIFGHGCVVGIGQALEQGGHNLTYYQGHNEQGMAHAAIAFAKQKKRREIIACTSSIGPGALNMVTACGTATANRIPLLVLPGDTFACRQPDPVLQQVEQTYSYAVTANDAFKAVCKYWDRIQRPEQLMTACLNAMRVLTDPADTGAVCLAMPQDVEAEAFDYPEHFLKKRVWYVDRRVPSDRELDAAAEMIKNAKKPMMIVGGGVTYSESYKAALDFAEKYNIPIGETQAGKGQIPWNHPLNMGGCGVTGTGAANAIAKQTDLVIAVGTRLTDFTTCSKWGFQNPDVKMLSINVCSFDAFKMDSTAVIADAKLSLEGISAKLGDSYKSAWTDEYKTAQATFFKEIDRLYNMQLENGFSQTRALGIINESVADDAVAIASAGSLPGCMQRLWKSKSPYTYHVEYGFSCMGYEICGALGAKIAEPEKEIYTMVGDGSFLMLHSELYTAIQEGLKINVMLFDNSGWGCIENLQNNQGTETYGTRFTRRNDESGELDGDVIITDFAKIAEGYGCKSYRVTNEQELIAALEDSKKQTVPVLFDIKVAHKSMSDGYDSWWRVGVAEVSTSETVKAAYEDMKANIEKARLY
ncbi:MAG: 3D-(3,5/4)-trihydroxycyclohexane-1,2-dione acylhydrolase (decyclizing) [Faecalibacterium sp.]|nr:3D-(3,5/4)-trihydroxycyclohexane-1,2-dione acylhydrolase (decyclizing) [Ruminococcus sp.]MCM1393024.1 3D-(3,5/4)-trihydroxycyclohexane-1,2-dione acylhydrolase (decyclizing) [Ruminococcus sp.]MCM1485998.1 3D-(3,5/4)-trihydroxycyclohexane-1,2-dione acylhydrolase (decyclizing) [Faecalibacterium sp.]